MRSILCWIIVFLPLSILAQKKVTLSGKISDNNNGEEIIGATIYIDEIKGGTVTNVYGYYSISLDPGTYNITINYLGYGDIKQTIDLTEDTKLNLEMKTAEEQLNTVVVTAEKLDQNVTSVEMSVEKMDVKTIKKMPSLLGEVDIIRSTLLLPGVTNVGEGASGFNVRGGNVDQNLILLDEAPVYNSSHLFGFFSVFNSDAIKDLKLYKGGIPAEYGGRLSSVMDVRQKEGNMKKFAASGGISTVSSKLTLEGPIAKDKSSFMVAARRTYIDWLAHLVGELENQDAYFYDLNAKVNYVLNDNNRLFLSAYYGNDVFKFGDDFRFVWGNNTFSARWNHIFNQKLFSNFTLLYSDYAYSLGVPEGTDAFEWTSHIINTNLKGDFSYFINSNNTFKFGVSALQYTFKPGDIETSEESFFNSFEIQNERAFEPAVYASNEHKLNDRLTLQYGLRYSMFLNYGAADISIYENDEPIDYDDPNAIGSVNDIVDTVSYKDYEVIKSFDGFEPRFSLKYQLDEFSSIKASYNRTRQYIHLVSNTTTTVPIDIWKPSGMYVEPATADQVALGYFRNFNNNKFEFSGEVYYKDFQNLLDYVDGANLILNESIETELLSGDGRAYGFETQIKKKSGTFTGWISYTLARTERQVTGINNSEWYPSNYDKLHDVSVVGMYTVNDKWELSANFAYMSGRPITYPDGKYEQNGGQLIIPNYGNRNGARLTAYHRLDFAATLTPRKNKDRRWQGEWVFSIYNVYGRRNAYSISFRQNEENPSITEAYRLSILGTMLPSVGYNFKF